MNNKHAFLVMAHHKFEILQQMINVLDDDNVDFYIHIDKKIDLMPKLKSIKSKIIYIKRINVNWGGYSQIQCTINLLKSALQSNVKYIYFHFLTGVSFPIKTKNYILNFFNKSFPKEFIGFNNDSKDNKLAYSRVKYIYLFNESGKKIENKKSKIKFKLRNLFIKFQDKIHYNRFKKFNLILKKGTAYFSITQTFASYVINNEKTIRKMFKYSYCGDELFMQTLINNSKYKDKVYNYDDEYIGSQTASCWPNLTNNELRENNCFLLKDFNTLKSINCCFALKFEGSESLQLINLIKSKILCVK